jgi:hypothetical protein
MFHPADGKVVNLPGSHARLNKSGDLVQDGAGDGTSRPHRFQVTLAL